VTQGRLVLRELRDSTLSNSDNCEPDDALLVQAARDDPTAFAPLYERYRERVHWYLRTRTASPDEAGDLLQHVFLRALDRLDQYNPRKGAFAGWLFGIARNITINTHRDRRTTVSWDSIPDVLRPASPDDPEAQALRNESLEWLASAFARLDRNKRELLVLRYVVGLSFAEIAATVGRSEPSVRQQVSRTIRALKEQNNENA
jgi:RNA polymerase sigma-70 factor, ECF subfamily